MNKSAASDPMMIFKMFLNQDFKLNYYIKYTVMEDWKLRNILKKL